MPDVGHMMQAVLTAIGGGQNYAVDLVGLVVQIKTGDFHLVGGMVTVGIQLHSGALYGGLGGVDLAKLPLAAQQVIPCGDVVGRGLTELVVSVALVLKQGICAGVGGGGFLALQGNGNVVAVGIGDLLCILQRPRGQHLDREGNAGDVGAICVDVVGTGGKVARTGLVPGGAGHSVNLRCVVHAGSLVEVGVGDVHLDIAGGQAVFLFHLFRSESRDCHSAYQHSGRKCTCKYFFQSHGNTPLSQF